MRRLFFAFIISFLLPFHGASASDLGKGRAGDLFFVHHPPDPVNTRTGNFFLPLQDYYLPCFNYPLEVYRSYNSFSTKNGPFGHGWTFNYDIEIVIGQQGGLKVVEADGFVNEYIPVENQYQSQKDIIQEIIEKKKQEDIQYTKNPKGKGQSHYEAMEKRLLNDPSYYDSLKKRYNKASEVSPSGKYISRNRGTSYLTKQKNGFVRENENGQKESYNEKGLLIKIEDRNENNLRFTYDPKSRLSRVLDACGNSLHLTYNKNNKISSIRDNFQRSLSYDYDKKLRLVSFTGLDKKTMQYQYDEFDRMTQITFEDGTSTAIVYTKNGQVDAQEGPGNKHTDFDYGKNGNTKWTKVTEKRGKNNTETTEYRYTDVDNKIVQIAPDGTTTTTILSSCCGKPISIKSSDGINDVFVYSEDGNLVSRTNALNEKTTFEYEPRFDGISDITEHDGRKLRYRYDRSGNLIFAQSLDQKIKKHLKISYESHGKIDHIIDHTNTEVLFTYSDLGKITSMIKKVDGKVKAQLTFTYDKMGNTKEVTFLPNQPTTPQELKTTLKSYMELLEPTGIDFEI